MEICLTTNFVSKIDEVAKEFGFTLKEKQKEVISEFVSGNDVFCCLLTRYGKSLCYFILQRFMIIFVMLKVINCIMCITTSCINDQKKIIEIGISAEFISETHCDIERV